MKIKLILLLAVGWLAVFQMFGAADTDLPKLAAANNAFAFNLLRQLAAGTNPENLFVSPYSAATALQLAASGAAGRTRTEMEQVLQTADFSAAAVNEASKAAAESLNSKDTNVILATANGLWYRQGAAIKTNFLDSSRQFFAAAIKALDFGNAPAAEAEINQWASDQTHGRITGIANGMINPYTDLILANAIYFKGKWQAPFDRKLTRERPFHPAAGPDKQVPMMELSKKFVYCQGADFQAVKLPYIGNNLAMFVFLPDPGSSPAKLLQTMNGDHWRRLVESGFGERRGLMVLPKFKLENTLELNAPLEALGMKTAFDPTTADFSGMFSDRHHISEVRQKAFVDVSEEGTEAAAVTTIAVGGLAIREPLQKPFAMIVDRPFWFAIVDARSGMILFLGVVNDP